MIPTMKKSACLILSFVLILSGILMMPGNGLKVRATVPTEVNDFAALQSLINSSSSGQEFTVRSHMTSNDSLIIEYGKNVIIDLDGHTITVPAIYVDGTVVLKGNGTIILSGLPDNSDPSNLHNDYLCVDGGSLTINGNLTIQKESNADSDPLVSLTDNANLIMNGGTISTGNSKAVDCNNSVITMNGGTIENNSNSNSFYTVYLDNPGIFYMYGGTVRNNGSIDVVKNQTGCFAQFGGTNIVVGLPSNPNATPCFVTFKVNNGSWNDNTTADKTVTFSNVNLDWAFTLTAECIPAVGNSPDNGYYPGAWDENPANRTLSGNVTFTYTYSDSEPVQNTAPSRPSISENDASNYRPAPYISNNVGGYMAINGQLLPGVTMCKEKQGPACITVFNTARPAGWSEAFTFNMIINGKTEHTLKNGTLTLPIPAEFQKAGRTFALIGVDKTGKPWTFADVDDNPYTITANINVEGYAFALIYKD